MRPILLSLKPDYANLVFGGWKRAELRRRIARDMEGRNVFIYVSSPERRLRGGFTVGRVWSGSPEDVWQQVSRLAQVDRETFDSYYEGCSMAFAFAIVNIWEYKHQPDLAMLRKKFLDFVVPQSWRYLRPEEHRSFRRMKQIVKVGSGSEAFRRELQGFETAGAEGHVDSFDGTANQTQWREVPNGEAIGPVNGQPGVF